VCAVDPLLEEIEAVGNLSSPLASLWKSDELWIIQSVSERLPEGCWLREGATSDCGSGRPCVGPA